MLVKNIGELIFETEFLAATVRARAAVQFKEWNTGRLGARAWFEEPGIKVYVRIESIRLAEGTFTGVNVANYEGDRARLRAFLQELHQSNLYPVMYLELPETEMFRDLLLDNFQIDRFNTYSARHMRHFYRFGAEEAPKHRFLRYGVVSR